MSAFMPICVLNNLYTYTAPSYGHWQCQITKLVFTTSAATQITYWRIAWGDVAEGRCPASSLYRVHCNCLTGVGVVHCYRDRTDSKLVWECNGSGDYNIGLTVPDVLHCEAYAFVSVCRTSPTTARIYIRPINDIVSIVTMCHVTCSVCCY
ncbi:ORF051 [Infectious spleen and kidney necrosis virus]|nr:ORF051 [Infectious spleen and kidney necrosis virus]UWH19566.1 ORF051 [Infectious spleen and kidney necrosis virus]